MAGASDAEQLQIDAARLGNLLFVLLTVGMDLIDRQRSVGNVNVPAGNIDAIEQMFVHEAMVALQLERLHRIVLVEVEGHDVCK
jgi:hypothetical protein